MTIDQSNFDAVAASDLDTLVQTRVPEGLRIEYKGETYGSSSSDKHEFLKDVSSLANTSGGHLLIGITERAGLPTGIPGLPNINIDQELLRLEQMAHAGIEPRMQLRMRRIALANGQHVIAIRVAQSWSGPHRVIAQNSMRFYRRNSAGCYEASLEELRSMFSANNDIAAWFRSYRERRVRFIRGGGLNRPLLGDGQLVMHVVPAASIFGRTQVDLTVVEGQQHFFAPLEVSSLPAFRYNLDGAITERGHPTLAGYTQVYRNGKIETTKGHILRTPPEGEPLLPGFAIERAAIATLRRIISGMQVLDVPPPFIVGLSMIDCGAAYYRTRETIFEDDRPPPLGGDEIYLPEGQVDGYGGAEVIDAGLRPAFDALWNSAKYPRAGWFDDSGEWKGPPVGWTT
ncbi:MAG: ATP-binding protein [Reyranella sp.]|nr:ATP-binding protein [Reyranella sp.]